VLHLQQKLQLSQKTLFAGSAKTQSAATIPAKPEQKKASPSLNEFVIFATNQKRKVSSKVK
jgi:hypothetical protein